MIKAILACDGNYGIGKNSTLPWPHNSDDLKWFRNMTLGSVVIMGRNTWESPDMPKPLTRRINVVVSSRRDLEPRPHVITSWENLEKTLYNCSVKFGDVWIIGGGTLINSCLDLINEIHLNRFHEVYDCDTFLDIEQIEEKFDRNGDYGKISFNKKKLKQENSTCGL